MGGLRVLLDGTTILISAGLFGITSSLVGLESVKEINNIPVSIVLDVFQLPISLNEIWGSLRPCLIGHVHIIGHYYGRSSGNILSHKPLICHI